MKSQLKYFLSSVAFLIISFNSFSGELTGAGARALLIKNGIDPASLERSGARIVAGELTGAGKTVGLKDIKYFMTNAEVFPMEEVRHVELNTNGENHEREGRLEQPKLQDVKYLEVNEKKISQQLIQGLVIFQRPVRPERPRNE